MFEPCDFFRVRPWGRPLVLGFLLFACFGVLLSAQEGQGLVDIVSLLEEEYRVVSTDGRYVLVANDREKPVQLIEVEDGSVSADGLVIDADRLRELLDEDAEVILELARLTAEGEEALELPVPLEPPEPPEEPEEREEPEEPEEPRERQRGVIRTDTRVSFGNSLTVEENEQAEDVVVFGGALKVLGEVRGDAVAIGGPVWIEGEVDGDVVAVGGLVKLGPEAVVNGEVTSLGGGVEKAPGSEVRGVVTELSGGPIFEVEDMDIDLGDADFGAMWPGNWFGFGWNDGLDLVGNAMVLTLVILGLLLLSGNLVPRIADRVEAEPWKSALVGLLVQVLFFPVIGLLCIILLISVVGIPLAILALPLSLVLLVVLFFFGYAAVALSAGRWLDQRFDRKIASNYLLVILGILLIQGWSILGEMLGFLPGPIRFTAMLLVIGGFLLKYVAWTTGLGAMVLHVFGPKSVPPTWADPDDPYAPRLPGSDFPISEPVAFRDASDDPTAFDPGPVPDDQGPEDATEGDPVEGDSVEEDPIENDSLGGEEDPFRHEDSEVDAALQEPPEEAGPGAEELDDRNDESGGGDGSRRR